jgi:hypothetical protein
MKNDALNPQRFNSQISRTPEMLRGMSQLSSEELTPEEVRARRINAIGNGASALALSHENKDGESNLDSHIFNLIAHLHDFYEAQKSIDAFREKYNEVKHRNIDPVELNAYKADKQAITEFNHILRNVIEEGADYFNFSELLQFMTQEYKSISGASNVRGFYDAARMSIAGMRSEVAVEEILEENGVDFTQGTLEDDARGGDFIINDTRIDIKAGRFNTTMSQLKATEGGYSHEQIVWSRIEFEDFEGNLRLSTQVKKRVAKYLIPSINQAAGTDYQAIAS